MPINKIKYKRVRFTIIKPDNQKIIYLLIKHFPILYFILGKENGDCGYHKTAASKLRKSCKISNDARDIFLR